MVFGPSLPHERSSVGALLASSPIDSNGLCDLPSPISFTVGGFAYQKRLDASSMVARKDARSPTITEIRPPGGRYTCFPVGPALTVYRYTR